MLMNGAYISVIDSYISDCKEDGADSQALAAYSTTGPIKIVNNYLEGAGENVIFGGADPGIPNAVASDIEIRCNHFYRDSQYYSLRAIRITQRRGLLSGISVSGLILLIT